MFGSMKRNAEVGLLLWERHLMAAVAFGEGRLPRWNRGWKPLPQERDFIMAIGFGQLLLSPQP